MKINSDDPKDKGRFRRRNMIAKAMLEERRKQYTERKIKNLKTEDEEFNKHRILKGMYDEYDE